MNAEAIYHRRRVGWKADIFWSDGNGVYADGALKAWTLKRLRRKVERYVKKSG